MNFIKEDNFKEGNKCSLPGIGSSSYTDGIFVIRTVIIT